MLNYLVPTECGARSCAGRRCLGHDYGLMDVEAIFLCEGTRGVAQQRPTGYVVVYLVIAVLAELI